MKKTDARVSKRERTDLVGTKRYKILIVEDQEFFQRQLTISLRSEGYDISVDYDGGDALERIVKGGYSPDLMITDINMPRMDGLELINYLEYKEYTFPIIVNSDAKKNLPSYSGKLRKMAEKDSGSKELKAMIKEMLTD